MSRLAQLEIKTKPTQENTGDHWPRNTRRQLRIGPTTQNKLGWTDAERFQNNTKPKFRNINPKPNLTYCHDPTTAQTRRRISGRLDSRANQPKTWKNLPQNPRNECRPLDLKPTKKTHRTRRYPSHHPRQWITRRRPWKKEHSRVSEFRIATVMSWVRLTIPWTIL